MAKITTWKVTIAGKYIELGVYYSSSKLFYLKGMPSDVEALTEKYFEGLDTERKLYDTVQVALHEYHEKIEKQRKVIACTLYVTDDLRMNKVAQGSWLGLKKWVSSSIQGTSHTKGNGFTLEWKVLMEVSGRKTEYHSINDDGSVGFIRDALHCQIIEWSPQREQVFRDIDASLEKMVSKIAVIMGDREKLLEMADCGIKLLE